MNAGSMVRSLRLVAVIATALSLALPGVAGAQERPAGFEFIQACAPCHGPSPKYPLLGARAGYDRSGHKTLGNSAYANGGGCQQCHTNEGFIEYVATGKVDDKAFVANPSQPGCFTCHNPHGTGTFALRTVAPVTLANGKIYNQGAGNLCASCHRARRDASKEVKESAADKVSSPWGAHHGPQADMIMGTNAYEFAGQAYSRSDHTTEVTKGCVQCHMTRPQGRFALTPAIGGHAFFIGGEVHEAEVLNTAGCGECHKEIKKTLEGGFFDVKARADYDLDGTVEPVQAEVTGLLEKFVNPKGDGLLQRTTPAMYDPAGKWAGAKSGTWSLSQMAALYDYKFVLEDRSRGVHNTAYAVQILYDSAKALNPAFDVSRRPK